LSGDVFLQIFIPESTSNVEDEKRKLSTREWGLRI
jgi:hypothetical protein